MKPILIIIRGNSSSGKTVLANKIQKYYGCSNCLLLHQDIIRIDMLHADDHPGTKAISAIKTLVQFGLANYPITLLEGILRQDVYGEMIENICDNCNVNSLVYYLDISFNRTLKYDKNKQKSFGYVNLKSWWKEKDYLTEDDNVLRVGGTLEFFEKVITDVNKVA